MSDFQNIQPSFSTPHVFSYVGPNNPGVTTTWVEGALQTVGSPVTYISTGYQPQSGQFVYSKNLLQNSGFLPQVNLNQYQQSFPESFLQQNSPWGSSSLLLQSTSNLGSPLLLRNPLVPSPLFVSHNVGITAEQLIAPPTFSTTAQVTPAAYPTAIQNQVPISLSQVNGNYQQQQHLLKQHGQPQQQLDQQTHTQMSSHQPYLDQINDNSAWSDTEDRNHNVKEIDLPVTRATSSIKSDNKDSIMREPRYSTLPSLYQQNPEPHRPAALSYSLPTSLNPSLQIKTPMSPVEAKLQDVPPAKFGPTSSSARITGYPGVKRESKMGAQNKAMPGTGAETSPVSSKSPGTGPTMEPDTGEADNYVVKPNYEKPKNKELCMRCSKKVYPMERLGPIKDVLYHKNCFTCVRCGSILKLQNFHHNPNDIDDLNVFCVSHKPKEKPGSCDASSVHIRSALIAPKLDKINDQIRSDRYPSEVLARSGYQQPAASAHKLSREDFYYGMSVEEISQNEKAPKLQEELVQQATHQELYQQYQILPNQELNQQLKNDGDNEGYLHHTSIPELSQHQQEEHQDQEHYQLLQENMKLKLQQQLIEDEKTITNNFNFLTLSTYEDTINRKSPTLSSSSLSSSLMHQESISEDSLRDEIAPSFKLDSFDTLKLQGQEVYSKDGLSLVKGDQVLDQFSPSISPLPFPNSPRSTEDNESGTSSVSSNFSSSRESLEFGATAMSYSGRAQVSRALHERADRPSERSIDRRDTPVRMLETVKTENNLDLPDPNTEDSIRFLPKNERMRMDRPSQYH